MRFRLQMVIVAALVMCCAAVASAQPQRGGQRGGFQGGFGGGFGGGQTRLALLGIEEVQKELGLTEDQIAAIRDLRRELGGGRGGRGGQPGEGAPRRRGQRAGGNNEARLDIPADWYFVQQPRGQRTPEQIEEARRQAEQRAAQEREKLAEILKPEQVKRLNEIFVQVQGVNALNDAEVAKELEITDDQKEKMAKVREESRASARELFGPDAGPDAAAKREELRKSTDEKILAVLVDSQKKKFEEMKGKPFTMPERTGPGAGGRRGGNRPADNTN